MNDHKRNVLVINSSARQQGSLTRRFADKLVTALQQQHGAIKVQERDVAKGVPLLNEQWVEANFTAEAQRTTEQKAALLYSDSLVTELQLADIIILAVPLYNFAVPASLKAWIDQVARVGLTFNYTEQGPVGKLQNKQAYIVMATGGTEPGSEIDFASDYLRHVLGFMGIKDVTLFNTTLFNLDDEQCVSQIRTQIQQVRRQVA